MNLPKNSIAMVAPSFLTDFKYPDIIYELKQLGFDKVVEVTFGAKMINRDHQEILKKNKKKLLISSACPGIVESIKKQFPELKDSIMPIDSPMVAMAKICKKNYLKHKIYFITPCHFKKTEAKNSRIIEGTIDYQQLKELFKERNIKCPNFRLAKLKNKNLPKRNRLLFDRFYNDYTKIYPLSGGLTQTAHIKGILKCDETLILDGWEDLRKFLGGYVRVMGLRKFSGKIGDTKQASKALQEGTRVGRKTNFDNPKLSKLTKEEIKKIKKIRFLDVTFCVGGCIGGPCTNQKISLKKKHKRIINYMKRARKQDIPEDRKGIIKRAEGIKFTK